MATEREDFEQYIYMDLVLCVEILSKLLEQDKLHINNTSNIDILKIFDYMY